MKEAEVFLTHELKGKEQDINFIENNYQTLVETVNKITHLLDQYFSNDSKKIILIADDSNIILNFLEKNIHDEFSCFE